jgi:hypothetical protein
MKANETNYQTFQKQAKTEKQKLITRIKINNNLTAVISVLGLK